jgi:hypothetical protein
MASANRNGLAAKPSRIIGLNDFLHDVGRGFLAASRTLLMGLGCLTLAAVVFSLVHTATRDRLAEHVPALLAQWVVPDVAAAGDQQAAVEQSPPAGQAPAAADDPQQRSVVQYLARRYRVADEAVSMLVAAAFEAGRELALDPLLILAVMAVESSMNPFAESAVGAQGLMQVMTRVHADKFQSLGGGQAALDPIANIKVGSAILKDLVRRGGSVERGLQLYVGAGNLEDDGGYAARVLAERARIEVAAGGKIEQALNAGYRADTAVKAEARALSEGAVMQDDRSAAEASPGLGERPVKGRDSEASDNAV